VPRIHWQGLFLGGLLAGFVDNLLQFAMNRLYLFRFWHAAMVMRRLPMTERTDNRFALFIMILVGGLFCVWLYGTVRSQFGSGPGTAALAGGIFWLLSWLFPVVLWSFSGPLSALPPWLLATHLLTHLGVTMVATMLGAWAYERCASQQATLLVKV
jgi:hypothetical protein